MMPLTAAEIAQHLQGEVLGDGAVVLKSLAPADTAQAGDLTFADNDEYFARAEKSAAAGIIAAGTLTSATKVVIRVKNARIAFAKALALFFPEPVLPAGIHPTAVIAPDAQVDATAHIGPQCVVGARTKIGPRAALIAGVCVAENCTLGEDVALFPNVTIYAGSQLGNRVRVHAGTVIGADGYGYVLDGGVHRKIPQIGNVIIGDDVELGANVTVDRGALGATVIGKGTKIDNLTQIAHNVQIGEHCIIVSQVGIAGSTKVGNYCVFGGQVGIVGHLQIGNQVTIAAKSGVMNDLPDGAKVWGTPAQSDMDFKRQVIALQRLPELLKRVAELEKQLRSVQTASDPQRPA